MKLAIVASLLAAGSLSACATDSAADDPLAEESAEDGEAGKADGADAFTFFQLAPDATGFSASRANRAKTLCLGGQNKAACAVEAIDWSTTGLPADATAALEDKLRAGSPILVRGDLASDAGPRIAAALQTGLATTDINWSFGDEAGPDCLYGRYHVTNVVATSASVTTSFDAHSTLVRARLDGVTLTGTSEFAQICIDGTSPFSIKLDHVTITGRIAQGSSELTNASVTSSVTGIDAPGMPDAPLSYLTSKSLLDAALALATSRAYAALGDEPAHPILAATEVWVPGSDMGTIDGTFVLAKDNGVRCITAPCPSTDEQRLNANNRAATIDEVDFTVSGASDESIERASADLATRTGVLVVGERYTFDSGHAKGRRANQFWTKAR